MILMKKRILQAVAALVLVAAVGAFIYDQTEDPDACDVCYRPMHAETLHFLDAVALDRPVLVTPEQARRVLEVYTAADLSAERNEPVRLPLQEPPDVVV